MNERKSSTLTIRHFGKSAQVQVTHFLTQEDGTFDIVAQITTTAYDKNFAEAVMHFIETEHKAMPRLYLDVDYVALTYHFPGSHIKIAFPKGAATVYTPGKPEGQRVQEGV